MSDYDFGEVSHFFEESLMSYHDKSTTDLEDIIKHECVSDGCYNEPENINTLKFIADDFSENPEYKNHLPDYLLNEVDLMDEFVDAIVYMNYSLIPAIVERLKERATKNLKSEIKLIAEKLL